MPSPSSNGTSGNTARRSQPVSTQPRTVKGKPNNTHHKTPRASPGSLAPSSTDSNTSSGSSGAALSDISRASKKIGKAVRNGKSGGKAKAKTNKEKVGGGPEAELSEDEDDLDELDELDSYEDGVVESEATNELIKELGAANVPHERIVQGAEGKSVPRSEIGMDSLIAGAKHRPGHPNISRGYEMLTNPAARMVITFDREDSKVTVKPPPPGRKDSLAASIAFSDESEWENVQFEMDEFDGKAEPVVVPVHVTPIPVVGAGSVGPKSAYADIVKRRAAPVSA